MALKIKVLRLITKQKIYLQYIKKYSRTEQLRASKRNKVQDTFQDKDNKNITLTSLYDIIRNLAHVSEKTCWTRYVGIK